MHNLKIFEFYSSKDFEIILYYVDFLTFMKYLFFSKIVLL